MMSPSAQALYFHIGMNADDDGFCEVFTIVRMTESKPDDLRSLHERGFIFLIDSKVGIVKDWHTNNDIRSDRYTRSKYLNNAQYGDVYKTIMQDKIQHLTRYKNEPLGITEGSTGGTTQVRLGKDSIHTSVAPLREEKVSGEEIRNPSSKSKYPHALEVFALWGAYPKNWTSPKNSMHREAAENLYTEQGIEEIKSALAYIKKHKSDDYFPQIETPYDLDNKWLKLEAFYDKQHA